MATLFLDILNYSLNFSVSCLKSKLILDDKLSYENSLKSSLDMQKLWILFFTNNFIKAGSEWVKPVDLGEDHTPSKIVDWCYRISNKKLYQIRETTSLEDSLHIVHLRENKDVDSAHINA